MSILSAVALAVAVAALLLMTVMPAATARPAAPRARGPLVRWRSRSSRGTSRDRALHVLRSLQGALRSGLPLAPALRVTLERLAPHEGDPFTAALRAFELNARLEPSLQQLADDAPDARVTLGLQALAIVASEELPSSRAALVIGSVADRLEFDRRLSEEIAARTSGLRAQIVMLALLVPAIALYLVVTLPGLADTLSSPLGRFVLVPVAAMLEIAGLVASRAIIRGATR